MIQSDCFLHQHGEGVGVGVGRREVEDSTKRRCSRRGGVAARDEGRGRGGGGGG